MGGREKLELAVELHQQELRLRVATALSNPAIAQRDIGDSGVCSSTIEQQQQQQQQQEEEEEEEDSDDGSHPPPARIVYRLTAEKL